MAFGEVNPVGFVSTVGGVVSKFKSRRKRKKARKLQRQLNQIRFAQQKRQFMKQFRAAQQEQLLAGFRAGGLESSAFQGQRAATATQGGLILGEFEDQTLLGRRIGGLLESAASSEERAALFSGTASIASDLQALRKG